jgi:hypothetical protein
MLTLQQSLQLESRRALNGDAPSEADYAHGRSVRSPAGCMRGDGPGGSALIQPLVASNITGD